MAETSPDKDNKSHEASQYRISQAIEKGNLPFSREVILFSSILAYVIIVFFVITNVIQKLSIILQNIWQQACDIHINSSEDINIFLSTLFLKIGSIFVPIFIILITATLSASILQNAPRLILNRIQPKFERISIKKGIDRIYSINGFIEFIKTLFKFIGISILLYLSIFKDKSVFINAFMYNQANLPEYLRSYVIKLLIYILIYMTVIASLDFVWSQIKWRKNLRMSYQEVKDEYKQLEGDPLLKARMRSLARSRSQSRMLQKIPQATVIIANPTHFSIALRYNPPQDIAPVVIAKGQDLIALKIKEIAAANNIEIIENVELARSLYKKVEIDQLIPEEFYYSVAEIIRYIKQHRK